MKKIGLYPGTFDPITLGHLDVIKTASLIFDEVIVAMLINRQKEPFFSVEERDAMVSGSLKDYGILNARAIYSKGLTVALAEREKATAIIRGLRLVTDFEAELTLAFNNAKLCNIPTIFVPPCQDHIHISSSAVRELLQFGVTE
ncbi:MAG: pantetheine-phosphate adenylyltransferase, partial [Candidatus Omnitrophota bacterium]